MKLAASFLILFLSMGAWAQSANLASDVVKIRNNIESEVRKNLEDLISTKLEKKTFTVAVRIQLTPIQPPKKEKNGAEQGLPDGMDIGSIDVRNLVDSYEKKIEELKTLKEQAKDGKQYQISAMEAFIGLDESYPEQYGKDLKKWLQARLSKDYGPVAKANVGTITPQDKKNMQPEEEESFISKLRPWTSVIAALALSMALVALGLLLKSGMLKSAGVRKNISLEQKGELLLNSSDATKEQKQNDAESSVLARSQGEELDQMIKKIAFVCLEIGAKINELVKVWIDANEEGFVKTALLVDCLICAREKIMTETGALAPLRIPIEQDMITNYEEHLSEAYRNVSVMPDSEKLDLMNVIYWDLISIRTLGLQSLRRPFDFLSQSETAEVRTILQNQSEDTRALALMYLPKETQTDLLTEMDEGNRTQTIRAMLLNSEVDTKKLWDHDTSVKILVESKNSIDQVRLVNLFPRTLDAIQSLTPLNEISTLRKVSPSLPHDGRTLKHHFLTFAFVDEWKSESLRRLTQIATAEEILHLMLALPACQESLLQECPPVMRTILEDDLKISASIDPNSQNQKLKSLKAKWTKLLQVENISLSSLYQNIKQVEDDEGSHAA